MQAPGTRKRLAAVLAADMAGYSRLMEADEHATEAALDEARSTFAFHIEAHAGRVSHMAGDSVLAVFPTAEGALAASLHAQDELNRRADSAPEFRRVLFRVGIHIGDISERVDGALYGDGVNVAARIQSIAAPGGVCISDATRAAIGGRARIGLSDQGEMLLKNITQPVRVFAVVSQSELRATALPIHASSVVRRSNLSVIDQLLVGRDIELAALLDRLDRHRLVTVVGAAGIGKTRLALEVASGRIDRHKNGVWWVDLAALSSPESIAPAIANAANLQLGEGDPVDLLARALARRDTLLVLDNCEHLVAPTSGIVQKVLSAAASVRILATSQVALATPNEQLYRLEGLPVPPKHAALEMARTFGALRLLELRTQAVDRDFVIDSANLADAVDLCRHLDGIPLAIEMAAARLPLLGLEGVRRRLHQSLQLLRGADRSAPPRHQTLRAMLDGSYSILDATERRLFRWLAVFSGNFRLEEAQSVAAAAGIDEWTTVDALAALVGKSLLHIRQGTARRYRLLETTRLYADELLSVCGELDAARKAHGTAMAALACELEDHFWRTPDAEWLDRYVPDYDDLLAAFERAAVLKDTSVAARVGNALLRLDHLRNVNPPLRARAEIAFGLVTRASGLDAALLWNQVAPHGLITIAAVPRAVAAKRAVDAWRAAGQVPDLYLALGFLGYELVKAGDRPGSRRALDEAERLENSSWPARRRMRGAAVLAGAAIYCKDAAQYRSSSRRELALAEEGGHARAAAWAKLKLADAALMAGDRKEAIELGLAAVAELEVLDQPSNLGLALANLSTALLMEGDVERARHAASRSLPLTWQNEWGFLVLDQVALIGALAGQVEQAAKMIGFTEAWLASNGDRRQPNESELVELTLARIRGALGAESMSMLREQGARMSKAAAEALAAKLLADPP